jgi:hypothetical protein
MRKPKQLKLYISPKLQWGLFRTSACLEYLSERGIEIVPRPFKSDIIVTPTVREAKKLQFIFPWKSFLVYAEDPRFDRHPTSEIQGISLLRPVRVMNVFTGEIFFDVYGFCNMHQIGGLPYPIPVTEQHFIAREKKLAVMMSFSKETQSAPPPPQGNNLHGLRVEIISAAFDAGVGCVMGAGWPAGFKAVDTSFTAEAAGLIDEPWSVVKLRWLKDYWFNLCFENTLAPYYVTEKIWHAVLAGCVPIYFGRGSSISDAFPSGSFVDYSEFDSPGALLKYLKEMTPTEAMEIYNKAQGAYMQMLPRRAPSHLTTELARARKVADRLQLTQPGA